MTVPVRPTSAISGIGMTEIGRVLNRSSLDLTCEAALGAILDAGLTPADIDGVCTWPGESMFTVGSTGPSVAAVQDSLGLQLSWYSATNECPGGPLGAVIAATMAVAAGECDHVLVYRTLTEGTARRQGATYHWHAELLPEGVGGHCPMGRSPPRIGSLHTPRGTSTNSACRATNSRPLLSTGAGMLKGTRGRYTGIS
jgi:hypothetical protein